MRPSTQTRTRTRPARGQRTNSSATRRVKRAALRTAVRGDCRVGPLMLFPTSLCLGADYALGKDCIMHGYMLKLGNPFLTQWQRRYFYLFPNRVEWRGEGESRVSPPLSAHIAARSLLMSVHVKAWVFVCLSVLTTHWWKSG